MKVCIAEKPSVARDIAQVIGATARKDGFFEGNGFQVTWTYGHLCQLKEPEDYDKIYKSWRLDHLPVLPDQHGIKLINDRRIKKQFNIIQNLCRSATEIVNCGDAGQEGELIQRWVYDLLGFRKPLKRLWISSLTEEAIREGFSRLHQGTEFDSLYEAGQARAIGDWLLGINATRLFSKKYSDGDVLSIGRVQTPTLALVVQRHEEIQSFQPQPFWELSLQYRETTFRYAKGKFFQKEKAQEICDIVKNSPFSIKSVETRKGKEPPPLLYDLTTLQMDANRRWSFTAEQALKTLQSLYEKKIITYPRVDTRYLSRDLYPKIPGILQSLEEWNAETEPLLGKKLKQTTRIFNDVKVTDHHAIIPTGKTNKKLPDGEKRIYELIVRRFIAAFYPDCSFSYTTVLGNSAEYAFKATGKQILDPGWQVLYGKDLPRESKNKEPEEQQVLPDFVVGESGEHQPKIEEKETRPPRPYSEATLLRAMETAGKKVDDETLRVLIKENGIGRPATRASIIETLFKRQYLYREKKSIHPTQRGIELIHLIQNPILKSAELTGQWEKKLRAIENREFGIQQFIEEMNQFVSDVVNEVKVAPDGQITPITGRTGKRSEKSKKKSVSYKKNIGQCPKCKKGYVVDKGKSYGCNLWKNGCDFTIWKERCGKTLSEKEAKLLLSKGTTPVIQGFLSKKGTTFNAALKLTTEFTTVFEFGDSNVIKAETFSPTVEKKSSPEIADRKSIESYPDLKLGDTCPQCGKGHIIRGKRAYGCSQWREGCHFVTEHVRH